MGLNISKFNIAYGAPQHLDFSHYKIKQAFAGQAFSWWIPPSQHNPQLTKILVAHGLRTPRIEHAMICDLLKVNIYEQTTDLIVKIVTQTTLQDLISVLEPYYSHLIDFANSDLLNFQEKFVVGYLYGKPVIIGILFISRDGAEIFHLVMSEECQDKKYITDMMIFMMQLAQYHGCNFVTLLALHDESKIYYEKLGSSKIGEFECFECQG